MSHISLRAIGKAAAAICLAVAMSGVAMAGDAPDRVVMQSPAKDAAVLAKMQGLVKMCIRDRNMPRYVMAIDASKCLNCKACLIACQQRNAVPYGLSRNWVRETPDTASPSGWRYQPGACMHCDEPVSYTHRDVYKRQSAYRAPSTPRASAIRCGSSAISLSLIHI